LRGEKGGTFIVGPGWHLASLRHWVMLIVIPQESYYNRLSKFF